MGAMTTSEMLTEQAKYMPEPLLKEVLDFMGYLRMKYNLPDVDAWDKQMDDDAVSGAFADAFDNFADEAIREHKAGRTTRL
jgi:hypothetical protein